MATFHSSKLISSSYPSPANIPHEQEQWKSLNHPSAADQAYVVVRRYSHE